MIARAAEPALVARTRAPEASGTGPKRNLVRSVLVRSRAVNRGQQRQERTPTLYSPAGRGKRSATAVRHACHREGRSQAANVLVRVLVTAEDVPAPMTSS
jgi:hypothetical protein